jgi:hypothetical protein
MDATSIQRDQDLDRAAGIYTGFGALFVILSFFLLFFISRVNEYF